jgi:NADPH-dependent glutamate synthase beta subunit-like oxidoreductase
MQLLQSYIDGIINTALEEDIHYVDVTTDYLIPEWHTSKAYYIAKDNGVLCGMDIAKRVFELVGGGVTFTESLTDGTEIALSGVFVLRNAVAPGTLLRGLAIDGSDIVVDRHMATNKPGCFAAGDCTGRPYQLAKAVGEGNVAAHSIVEYLAALEK